MHSHPVYYEDLAGVQLVLQLLGGDRHGVEEAEAPGEDKEGALVGRGINCKQASGLCKEQQGHIRGNN